MSLLLVSIGTKARRHEGTKEELDTNQHIIAASPR